ncbi:oxygenase MpaB family protein [Streptomyces sp. NBC_01546]|uniref:oxygenase MpaB family protein n=1 Tax=Streptomyces sp. NBC_01546 TaxID=2975872 RepID=UPI0038701B01
MGSVAAARIRARVEATVYGGDLSSLAPGRPGGRPWAVHHSSYRQDPVRRLNQTTGFIAVTSFGSCQQARAAIARVRRRHGPVRGTAPDGRPYAASDPALLTWVHVAEASCFLSGYQAYGGSPLTDLQCDRYFREMAVIAEELGASSVPASTDEVRSYLASVRRDLAPSDASLDAVRFLRGLGQDALERTAVRILMNAAVRVLPVWAPPQLNLNHPGPVLDLLHRAAAHALGAVLRFGCEPSPILETARARVNTPHAGGCVDHAVRIPDPFPREALLSGK